MVWLPHEVFLGEPADVDDICDAIIKLRENIDELTARPAARAASRETAT
jgi:hypothetical protein